jgi:carbon dioxide concentrating mechanism protein CcmN
MNLENLKIMQSNYLPPLEPIGDFRSYVCGDVVIDETAAIASGVLIQADQGGKITIGAGVCIGMGAVLHAQGGLLEIGAGANLGAGVLVYGTSRIGEGACIGASSSIVRAVIAKGAIVPPCSLISGLDQTAVEKEASPAIAQDLETSLETNKIPSPTNYSFTHTYSAAQPLKNKFVAANFAQSPTSLNQAETPDNIIERSTTETYVHTSVTATPESVIANSVERTVTETQVEIPNEPIAEQSVESTVISEDASGQASSDESISPEQTGSDLTTINAANSAQAKAYAQAQINRYIKRLFPQN